MLGVFLGLALAAADSSGLDPAALVGDLGSPRYRQRESAEAALTKLGRDAVPSLRAAMGAKDPEVRLRASAILSRIEGTLLVEPTPIAFDFREVPVVDAIRAINLQTGLTLQFVPEDDPARSPSRLTLRTAGPLPFWKGLDALCRAGNLHYDFAAPQAPGGRDRAFPLYPGFAPPPEPAWDSGPFRTHLASVHYQSEIQLSKPRPALTPDEARPASLDEPASRPSAPTRQFYLQIVTAAEPRLSMTRNGEPRVSEAVDDHGKSLLMPAAQAILHRSSGYLGISPSPVVRFRVDLAYPESSGRRIRLLKGAMPVIVATRKPDPLKVALDGATGRNFRSPDIDLTVREVRPARDGLPPAIELTLKPAGNAAAIGGDGEVDPLAARLESPLSQLEILGTEGEPLSWFPSSSTFNGEETRLTLSLIPDGKSSMPSTITYYGMTRVIAEVPFEFRDVPIP